MKNSRTLARIFFSSTFQPGVFLKPSWRQCNTSTVFDFRWFSGAKASGVFWPRQCPWKPQSIVTAMLLAEQKAIYAGDPPCSKKSVASGSNKPHAHAELRKPTPLARSLSHLVERSLKQGCPRGRSSNSSQFSRRSILLQKSVM